MRRSWVVHPFLVALFPVVLLYSRNFHAVPFGDVLSSASLILISTVVSWALSRWLMGDGAKAGLVVSMALVLFFSFGRASRVAERVGLVESRPIREAMVLAVEIVAMVGLVASIRARDSIPRKLTSACNAGSVALIAISLVGVISQAIGTFNDPPPRLASRPIPATVARPERLPDIYFLVLDAYGRSDVLNEFYGFDNRAFLDRLERKGFTIARQSTSNYCQTALSISATLDLDYHDDLAGSRSESRSPLKARVLDNRLFHVLKPYGYRFFTFATGFDITNLSRMDDYLAPSWNLSSFHALLADTTPIWLILGQRDAREPHRMHRERILNVFDRLPEIARVDGPTFTLAHVVAPHPPFVFGPDGEDRSALEKDYTLFDGLTWSTLATHGNSSDYASRYREQITYITRRAEEAIDKILANSPEPPIIILQGDHGPASRFDTNLDRPNDLHERMSILNACYLPGDARPTIDPSITPVNTFRVVLDRYFGSKLGRLEDRNYYSSYQWPYVFTNVTDQIR